MEKKKTASTSALPMHMENEKTGLTYTLHGDYYLPGIKIPESDRQPVGMWGQRRLEFLKQNQLGYYNHLLLSGKLYDHLCDVNKQTEFRMTILMEGYKRCWEITEELKAADPMKWVGLMNNARMEAEWNVMEEIICE